MKIHEYQAKELLAAAGAAVPAGVVVDSPQAALGAFDRMGGKPVVLKAQVHAGGRGKGKFKGSDADFGGVKFLTDRAKIVPTAEVMFKYPLVTAQTTAEGQPVKKLLVQDGVDIEREVYVGMVLDRAIGMPVLMASAEGGVDIEEVAATSPEKILKTPVPPEFGLQPNQASRVAFQLGFTGDQVKKAAAVLMALSKVFIEKDADLAEVNPLVLTKQGDVVALDAKIDFDDNAMFRHADLQAMRDLAEEKEVEVKASEAGLSYIQLDGNIGCLVNGAGLAMATMDIIQHHGGSPANFLDVGGGVDLERALKAFDILLNDDQVKAILVNIFGGIAKCDVIAEALVTAGKQLGFKVPVVARLEGTNVEQGRKILAESGLNITTATGLTEAAEKVVAAARG